MSISNLLPLESRRILVVDDDLDNRELVAFILESAGAAQITAVDSAQAALEAMAQQSFDLILSDLHLPNQDGWSLITAIRNLPPEQGGQTPAIAFSVSVREAEQQSALTSGFQRFLLKPIDPDQLVEAIVALLRQPSS